MNWGKSIILVFLLFAIFIFSLVVVCVKEDINLVSGSYYSDELKYQDQIDRISNVQSLSDKPTFAIDGNSLMLRFKGFQTLDSGMVDVFRPSDAKFDQHYLLHRESTDVLRFDVSKLPPGFYKVRMKWAAENKEYFIEDSFQL